jgi:hypothetical protein
MHFVVTSAADRTPSLPASLSAVLCGGLGYGRSATTLITPSASHPPLLPPGRRGDRLAGSPPHGRHRFQMHAIPEMLNPPGKPIHCD